MGGPSSGNLQADILISPHYSPAEFQQQCKIEMFCFENIGIFYPSSLCKRNDEYLSKYFKVLVIQDKVT